MCGLSAYIRVSPSFSEETPLSRLAPTLTIIFCFVTDLSVTPHYDDLMLSEPSALRSGISTVPMRRD